MCLLNNLYFEVIIIYSGYIVTGPIQRIANVLYYGIDTCPWPIDFTTGHPFTEQEIELLDFRRLGIDGIPLLMNRTQREQYVNECNTNHIKTRCLYCDCLELSELNEYDVKKGDKVFLGFDYASRGDDFYSCIVNDIIWRPDLLNCKSALNHYGLIGKKKDLFEFINCRENKKVIMPSNTFEIDNFIIYSVYYEKKW